MLLSSCFHNVCHFQVAFLACVVFKLVSLAFVTFQLVISGMYLFHSSFMVSFIFCSQFTFIACVAYKLFSWCLSPSSCFDCVCHLQGSAFVALVSLRLVFITRIALIFLFVSCVSVRFPQPL